MRFILPAKKACILPDYLSKRDFAVTDLGGNVLAMHKVYEKLDKSNRGCKFNPQGHFPGGGTFGRGGWWIH